MVELKVWDMNQRWAWWQCFTCLTVIDVKQVAE